MSEAVAKHQSQLAPADNKFHVGNGKDGKHYWITPWETPVFVALKREFNFDFDPCPYPLPDGFDGLTCEWGQCSYVNPPFGSVLRPVLNADGSQRKNKKGDLMWKKVGPTGWIRKAIIEHRKGKSVVLVFPVDKWLLMILAEMGIGEVRNLGDVRWLATEDRSAGNGTGRHIACFILRSAHA